MVVALLDYVLLSTSQLANSDVTAVIYLWEFFCFFHLSRYFTDKFKCFFNTLLTVYCPCLQQLRNVPRIQCV
jgi:hypothetical protein